MFFSLFVIMVVESMTGFVRSDISLCEDTTRPIGEREIISFGRAFLNATESEPPMSPLQMILPEDGKIRESRHTSPNFRLLCGMKAPLRSMKRITLDYEERAVCPFSHVENHDDKRIPKILNEVRCLCENPAHIASSAHFACESVVYRLPVLRLHAKTNTYQNSTEDIVLACIPILKHMRSTFRDDFLIEPLKVSYS